MPAGKAPTAPHARSRAWQAATTARYAHLSTDPLRAASDIIAGRIAAAMLGKPRDGGNVVLLKPKAG